MKVATIILIPLKRNLMQKPIEKMKRLSIKIKGTIHHNVVTIIILQLLITQIQNT